MQEQNFCLIIGKSIPRVFRGTVEILADFPAAPWVSPLRLLVQQCHVQAAAEAPFVPRDVLHPCGHGREGGVPPSGKVPTTRVRLRISRLSRSIALLAMILRRCSRGNLVYSGASAQPPMTAPLLG